MSAHISPRPLVVGETNPNPNQQTSFATRLTTNQDVKNLTKNQLKQIQYVHGEPTIQFTKGERQVFAQEEGLHQAVIIKFSSDTLEVKDLRTILPKHLGIKGNCLVGLLARRHILLRIDQYEDSLVALSKSVSFLPFRGEQYLYRVFPWTIDFNSREETSMAAVWISLPRLSPDLFAKRFLLSMASAVGRPIAIDKATQDKTRPSTARVKVILDLMDKLPKRMRLQYLDEQTGKIQENQDKNHKDNGMVGDEQFNGEKFQGDLRQILNEKRGLANIDQRIDDNTRVANANNNEIAIVEAIKNNGDRVVDTCVQDDTLVLSANDDVTSDSMVPVINLESDIASNPKLPTAGVLSGKNPSLAMIQDSCQANKVQQCEENLDQIFESGGTCDHDFTLKDNDKEGWTEVPSKTFSPAKLQQLDCTNPPCKEQTINCKDKVSRKIVCSNTFDTLMTNSDQ
ncbi:hypothetical protein KY285_001957 [Solanum tuberosum]|nr:hypothetical protein KY285_001957 [Solanum tuberosum]